MEFSLDDSYILSKVNIFIVDRLFLNSNKKVKITFL